MYTGLLCVKNKNPGGAADLYRCDRDARRGGGVAVYCRSCLQSSVFLPKAAYSSEMEIMWLKVVVNDRCYYIGAIYHPPKPIYCTDLLISCIDLTLEEIHTLPEDSTIILAGDFNQLPSSKILGMGLQAEFEGPSHEGHSLDRIYSSYHLFKTCLAVRSTIKTRHSAILAIPPLVEPGTPALSANRKRQASFRLRTPNEFASYHAHLSAQSWEFITESSSPAEAFGAFYTFKNAVFDLYFPLKSITIKDKDPPFSYSSYQIFAPQTKQG